MFAATETAGARPNTCHSCKGRNNASVWPRLRSIRPRLASDGQFVCQCFRPPQSDNVGRTVGRFDFSKFSLIFAPRGLNYRILYLKRPGRRIRSKNKDCLDAKKVILYSKNDKISKKSRLYNKTAHFASRQFLTLRSDTSLWSF